LVGHVVSDNASGAAVGAGTRLAIALLVYNYTNPSMNAKLKGFDINQFVKQKGGALRGNIPNQSRFLPN